jgi:hypothetical protein
VNESSDAIVGVDFGAPRYARHQCRKIIAIAANPIDWRRYRIDAVGMNERLLAPHEPPGWAAKELLNELLSRQLRVAAFDFPFCIPDALLQDEQFAADVGYEEDAGLRCSRRVRCSVHSDPPGRGRVP